MTRHEDDSTDEGMDLSRRDFTKALGAASIATMGAGASSTAAAAPTTQVGNGGYTSTIPSRPTAPPSPTYTTENVSAPIPTNEWWSRLLTTAHAETLFSHPLFTEPTSSGLEIGYTDEWEVGDGSGVDLASETDADGDDVAPLVGMSDTAYMPFEPDFTIGHTATSEFDQSLVDGHGDWHVTYQLGSADPSTTVTQVQGSPYLYLDYAGGGAELTFDAAPTVFEDRGNALGVTVDGNHYALFGPEGTTWSGIDSASLTNDLGSDGYLTVALLPDDSASTFDTFAEYAHHQVTETRMDWEYVETEDGEVVSEVRTTFEFTVDDRTNGGGTGTLAALYPHQHKYLADGESTVSGMTYDSPRGTMKLTSGSSFTTALTYPGILPSYPVVDSVSDIGDTGGYVDAASLPSPSTNDNFDGSLADKHDIPTASDVGITWGTSLGFTEGKEAPFGGSYWTGLNYNRWSETAALLDAGDWTGRRDCVIDVMKGSLEQWFTPEGDLDAGADELDKNHFFYDQDWGTMVAEVGGFGIYEELNDHHFHYGYYVKGASEVARNDPEWAQESNWGGMVKLLIQDYANPSRDDDMFPHLRGFSPYAGRSYASGVNPFHLGNNQEASSEAVNAYTGMIRWGAFTGQEIDGTSIRDLGIFLYTHEIHGALEYWFDWDQENHPDEWDREYASVVWDDGYSHSTWWTEDDEDAYAINTVPANGDRLYLGWDEDHAQTVYDELVSLKGSEEFTKWKGVLLELGAFADASNALSIFDDWESGNFPGSGDYYVPDMHNTKLHTYTTLGALDELGSPTNEVLSNVTFSHVFVDETGQKNYVVYNPDDTATTVQFSDGCTFEVAADTLAVQNGITGIDDPTAPTTPSDLSVTDATDTTVTLDWTGADDPESGIANYRIYRDGEQSATTEAPGATVTDLASATEHEFTVTAVNGVGGESDTSDAVTVATEANSEDYTISVSEPSPGSVEVAFTPTAATDAATLTYSVNGGSESTAEMVDDDGDGTWTATLSDVAQGSEISHSVTFDRAGNSYETMTATYVVAGDDTTAPSVPSSVSAANATPRTVDLSWDASTDGETEVVEYVIYEGSSELTTTDGTQTTVSGLSPGTAYEFSVAAVDRAGNESARSDRVGITTAEDPLAGLDGQEWDRVWADEFDEASIDTDTWGYDVGGGCGPDSAWGSCSWGNNESQYYTDGDNATIEDGSLVLEAREESVDGAQNPYTSARVQSSGKKTVQYGRIDVRATLPQGQGIWPAIWALGSNFDERGWPGCGEIDIMEFLGDETETVHGTVHGPSYSGGNGIGSSYTLDSGTFAGEPHTFSIVWDEDQIKWFVDGTQFHSVTRQEVEDAGNEWVFDNDFFLIFNVAVGGSWPGYPDDTTTFPQEMRIDYIRQYEAVDGDSTAPSSPSNLATSDASTSSVDLSWDAATDDTGVSEYVVTVDGEEYDRTENTSISVTGLDADTTYEFGVAAVDAAGNTSPTATVTGSTAAPSGPVLSVEFPDGNTVTEDRTVEAQLVLSEASEGLAGFDVVVEVGDTGVATIDGATVDDAFPESLTSVSVAGDGSTVTLEASDGNDNVQSGATEVPLGTITFAPQSVGETDVALAIDQVDADDASLMEPATQAGTLAVTEALDSIGDNPSPTDPDGDGLYEDVNGNGRLDADDVVVLFEHREDSNVTDQIEHFDFNENGRDVLDFDDINTLFEDL